MCSLNHCNTRKSNNKTAMFSCSSHPFLSNILNAGIDEHRWIIQIRQALDDEDHDQESDIPVSIFAAPNALVQISPESYTPQQVALGPYHHWRPELHEMERYKLSAAKRAQRQLKGFRFHTLVDHLAEFEPRLRACYHKYLNFSGEMLSWMIALDSCFLLDFLWIFVVEEGKVLASMSHLVDKLGGESGYNAVLRDMVMLENQIPLFVLRKMVEFEFGSSDEADELLNPMLMGFCRALSPFKTTVQELPGVHQVMKCAHLLDFLYYMIVPKEERSTSEIESSEPEEGQDISRGEQTSFQKVTSSVKSNAVSVITRVLISRPVKALMKLPWKILSNLPGVIIIKQVEYFIFSQESANSETESGNCDCNNSVTKPPLMEEIAIPSVTELLKVGVKFSISTSGISGITFDEKMAMLYLPAVSLDVNTEVTMRNLVAYEACSSSGPLIFTRYTELMNGIIDVAEDAKILREHGIVWNLLKCDEDVADLWNGMSKSVRLIKVPFLDKVIEDVNKYYNGRWKVRIRGFLDTHVSRAWKPVAFLAAVALLLFLMGLQAFCSVLHFA